MATVADRWGLAWEVGYPVLAGAAMTAGTVAFGPEAFRAMARNGWQIGAIYSSVFDVSAIVSPFLFTFYSFVVTTDRGFIGRAKASIYYQMMVSYTVRALVLGAILTIACIPMMVVEPAPMGHGSTALYIVAGWAGLTAWTFAAFVRAARVFAVFAGNHR